MFKRLMAMCFVVCTLAFVIGVGIFSPAAAKTYDLRLQCVYPETSHGGEMVKKFAKKVNEYTEGQIKVKIFWPNQLVSLRKAYDAVSNGMIEGVYSCSLYYSGTVPEVKTEFLPFTWRNPEEAADIYFEAGYLDLLREANMKHNVYFLSPVMVATMGCMTKFPVHTLADFKGKKLRAVAMDAVVLKLMGGAPVAIPGTENYQALKRGTVDGTIYPLYTIETYKLYEVVDYMILPGFHTPAVTALYLNLDFWKKLPENLKLALDRAAHEITLLSCMASDKWDKEAIASAQKHNVKVMTLPESEVAKARNLCVPLWEKVAKGSVLSQKAVDLLKNYLKAKGAL